MLYSVDGWQTDSIIVPKFASFKLLVFNLVTYLKELDIALLIQHKLLNAIGDM